MAAVLETQNLTYVYSPGSPFARTAVDHVNISIEEGEFVGVIGHTGSGKSTLIQQLNGLLRPTSGKILLHGKDIWEEPKKIRAVRFQVGMVFQYPEYQLFEETVLKDIAFGPKNKGLSDEEAMEKAKENDCMIVAHTEDMSYRRPGACVHDSEVVTSKGWLGIPSACESTQLIRDLEITKEVGNAYHACHISAKESVEALKDAKASGLNVSAEVTVHHLLLEDKDVVGPNWKMNPPLRSHEDRMSLIEGLENGTLDCIANDHAPHTYEEKKRSMDKAPFGIVSLESAFALLYTEFVHRQKRWTLAQLVNWMSAAPAKRFGLENVGQIKEGYNADLVLVDLEHESLIDIDTFESMGKNTPFNGWSVNAQIKETIVDGKTVWKG